MKILYAYEYNAADPEVQSGHPFAILSEFERQGVDVVRAFPLRRVSRWLFAPKIAYDRIAHSQRYSGERSAIRVGAFARQLQSRVRHHSPDAIFSPGSISISRAVVDCPIVFCADATFGGMLDFYPEFSGLSRRYVTEGHRQEGEALSRCAGAIYPSSWAADSAIRFYGADPKKIHVLPFGANLEAPPRASVIERVMRRTPDKVNMLFLGRDWIRKGGDKAVNGVSELRRLGCDARLAVVGPKDPPPLPEWVSNYGYVPLKTARGTSLFSRLMLDSHFIIGLSRAEAFGLAFCDALTCGLPAIAHDVGGISSVVRNGDNGLCFSSNVSEREIAKKVLSLIIEEDRYHTMAIRARDSYEMTYNWQVFVGKALAICSQAKS